MKVLVLGVSGMIGHAIFDVLCKSGINVLGASRSRIDLGVAQAGRLNLGIDATLSADLLECMRWAKPDVVINAAGLIKQHQAGTDPLQAISLNALLPHQLSKLCALAGARLIQISTDCVFSGDRGHYIEADTTTATDLYGMSKRLGEIENERHVITVRTSCIGRELGSSNGLVEWFLRAQGPVDGYRNAIFSGLPTVTLAHVIADKILPRTDLYGLYHVGADAIDKHDLLKRLARLYGVTKQIKPVDLPKIDRSLDSSLFRTQTGFKPASWDTLLAQMKAEQH